MVGVEVKIVDETLTELPTGEVGQIIACGKNAMVGYWNRPEKTQQTLVDGWVLTGDLGRLDEDGYLYLHDRLADVIMVDGTLISSIEVEHALLKHPAVHIVAVIGIPDDSTSSFVHAIVNTNPGLTTSESELIEHCRTLLDASHCPKSISFRSEPLPLTAPGKVLKRELRLLHSS
jgi:acyl-CoA synthetase (AMP-forming)/AMP-acid ligase II